MEPYLLVPTLWLGAMSIVSVTDSWRTARPKSAIAQVPFFFTRMFFDLRSLCAMPGFPTGQHQIKDQISTCNTKLSINYVKGAWLCICIYPVCQGSPYAGEQDH